MKLKTKLIHWGVFLLLSIIWWFIIPWTLSFPTVFIFKLIIWVFFFAVGMLMTEEDKGGWEAEWQ